MKLWMKSLLMFFGLLIVIAGTAFAYWGAIWGTTKTTLQSTHVTVGNTSSTITATEPMTLLLMGVDTGDASRGGTTSWDGNSDSMIVLTMNPKTNTSTMVSMERDTMTNILDANGNITSSEKMNAAYPSGYNANGIEGAASWAMKTVGAQAGINLNNFVAMNMSGLVSLVNDVGGIDIVNDSQGVDVLQGTSQGDKITLPVTGEQVDSGAIYISDTEPAYTSYVPYIGEGKSQRINGDQALVFSRDRHTLPNGDYGRIAHQREVITALMKTMLDKNNLSQYQKFLTDISGDIKTNIAVNETNLQNLLAYKNCFKKVVSIQYQGIGETVNGGSYQFTPASTLLAVQNAMLKSIGQPTIYAVDPSVVTYDSYYGTEASGYYLPSATITENGKSTVEGINTDGSFVKITADNSNTYVATNGSAASGS
ncbi:MAG: LCP family protein [Streptococcaceae bacterium]|jgi:LCP family protein required for cell wall assembly|nr:LCP family protein [Streptococcaceae bacterium]